MSGLALTLGLGQSVLSDAAGAASQPTVLSVTNLPDATVEITVDSSLVTVTVLAPSDFAGTYVVNPADLSTGPVPLVPPRISGVGDIGETLVQSHPGLWIHSGAAPLLTRQWLGDGAVIPGETGPTLVVPATEAGGEVALRETLADGFGQRASESIAVRIAPLSDFDIGFAGHGSVDRANAVSVLEVPGLPLGEPHPEREIYAVLGLLYGPASSNADIASVSIAGVPAAQVIASDPNNGPVEIWRASVPAGLSGNVVVTASQPCLSLGVALYRVIDAQPVASVQGVANGGTAIDLSLPAPVGTVAIAGAKSANSGSLSLSGVAENHSGDIRTNDFFVSGHTLVEAAGAPRGIGVSASAPGNIGGVAIILEATS
jgi:hypothetical protein